MKSYDVFLHTPIGKRKGEMNIKIENGMLFGFLSLFGNTEPIEGTVDESGHCSVCGKFTTLMKSVMFQAKGRIHSDRLQLAMLCDSGSYQLEGTPSNAKEVDN